MRVCEVHDDRKIHIAAADALRALHADTDGVMSDG